MKKKRFSVEQIVALLALVWAVEGCLPAVTWNPSVRGQVVERATGAPVAGALVVASYNLRAIDSDGDDLVGSAVTNADGRFYIPGRPSFLPLVPFTGKDFFPDFAVYFPVYDYVDADAHPTGFNSYRIEVKLLDSWVQPGGDPRRPKEEDGSCLHSGDWISSGPICRQICQHVFGQPCRYSDW